MKKEIFIESVVDIIQKKCPDMSVSVQTVIKNNNTKLHGITIQNEGQKIVPTIYMDGLYREQAEEEYIEYVANEIIKRNNDNQITEKELEIGYVTDFDRVKDKLFYVVVNYERNKDTYSEFPHRRFLDLMVIYKINISMGEAGLGNITVSDKLQGLWQCSEEELWNIANENTSKIFKHKCESMVNIMKQMFITNADMESDEQFIKEMILNMEDDDKMYVATNEMKVNGANVMLNQGFMKKQADMLGHSFYIIPSSIHELIFVNEQPLVEKNSEIREMVREVNRTQVQDDEILSDNLYIYDYNNNMISIAE